MPKTTQLTVDLNTHIIVTGIDNDISLSSMHIVPREDLNKLTKNHSLTTLYEMDDDDVLTVIHHSFPNFKTKPDDDGNTIIVQFLNQYPEIDCWNNTSSFIYM